jgi:predicted XRE-type DNA-binding protein
MAIEHVTPADGNVFEDLGFPAEEAENLKIRSRLMAAIKRIIRERDIKQVEAAELFGTTQPRISDIVRGKIDEFTIDSLVNMIAHAGVPITLDVPTETG